MKKRTALKPGDWVRVISLDEILATLDGEGRLEGLGFMPEMARSCGRRLPVTAVMERTCTGRAGVRAANGGLFVRLGDLRCGGEFHGSCDRQCSLLWKEQWIRAVDGPDGTPEGAPPPPVMGWPYGTQKSDGTYTCQLISLVGATSPISVPGKLRRGLSAVLAGEMSVRPFAKVYQRRLAHLWKSLVKRLRRKPGKKQATPTEALGLRPGDWVEVKSWSEIAPTLDRNHRNRGMWFSMYMMPFCGGRYRVSGRMEKFLDERSGLLRTVENTVILEGIACGGETTSGLCRRAEPFYWREIWLRRVEGPLSDGP